MTGILTFHRGPNYGGFLQAWHMREAIRFFGYKTTIVNYQGAPHYHAETIRWHGFSPGALKGLAYQYLKRRPFPGPVSELSEHPFETDPIHVPWKVFNKVVVGADVVWNYTHPMHGGDPAFFGAHPSQQDTRFVAYAPSCGDTPADAELPDYVRDGLSRFDSIHVRDEATATLVERATGTRPPLVVDPTWLQDDPEVPNRNIPRDLKYALVYGQGAAGARSKVLSDICRKRGLMVVGAASACEANTHRLYSINPYEWVDLFRRAECVITSTFHGLLYAIKFNKPVVFMVRGPSRAKSSIIIDRCGIQDRVVEEGQPFNLNHLEHCLTRTDGCEIPEAWRKKSLELLRKSLEA